MRKLRPRKFSNSEKNRSKAIIELKEWTVFEFEQELLKRTYNHQDIQWKYERLFKHYKEALFRPKIYIKDILRLLRKYHYYKEKLLTDKRIKVGAILDDSSSDEESSTKRSVISNYEFKPVLEDLNETPLKLISHN